MATLALTRPRVSARWKPGPRSPAISLQGCPTLQAAEVLFRGRGHGEGHLFQGSASRVSWP